MFNNTSPLNVNNAGYGFTSYNNTNNRFTPGNFYVSNTRILGKVNSTRYKVPKNAGEIVKEKIKAKAEKEVREEKIRVKRSAGNKIPTVKIDNIDPDLNGCAKINYNAGAGKGFFDFLYPYLTLQDLQNCAPKGTTQKYKCNETSGWLPKPKWFQSRYCKATQTQDKPYNECDEINLKAGKKGRYEKSDDLIRCMQKNGDTFTSNVPRVGCLFSTDLRNTDGSRLGSGIFCKILNSVKMPFRVPGGFSKSSDFFVPFNKDSTPSR